MFGRQNLIPCFWIIAVVIIITAPACSGGGGKGLSREKIDQDAEMGSGATHYRLTPSLSGPTNQILRTCDPTEHDPFGFIPVGWQDNCPLHPKSYVAHSGTFGETGQYVVSLISPDQATNAGVQSFHIESLSGWDSIQVTEHPENGDTAAEKLTIVARRQDAELVIISEIAPQGFLSTLENADYWTEMVGVTPLVTRIFYTPLN